MTFLSSAELTSMRTEIEKTLPDTCVIQEQSYASDGEGGGTVTWAAVSGGTVACRADSFQLEADMVYAAQDTLKMHYRLTVPFDAPLAEQVRVVYNSHNFEVIQIDVDKSWPLVLRAIIAELRS